jgi:golgin subfamily B member 1
MPLDEQVRQTAEALASDLGRELQQRLGQFVDGVLGDAAAERDALHAQSAQFAADAEARLEAAVAQARAEAAAEAAAEHEAAMARLREASAGEVAAALEGARAASVEESAAALSQSREAAAAELSAAVARAREEAASEASAAVARAREEVANASAQLQADLDARQADVERAALERQRDEREAMLAEMERLVEGFRKLDATTSLSALLDALADAAAQEAPRAALLLVRGQELQGWAVSGFADAPADPRRLVAPIQAVAELARVVETRGRVEVRPTSFAGAATLAFAAPADGDVGVAVPVTVGGAVAALLYADDGGEAGRTVPASWPETLELLARHAARCLEAQTAIRASRFGVTAVQSGAGSASADRRADLVGQVADRQGEDSARRYARLVVSDLRLSHEAAVRLGREQRDLGERLREPIERARDLYLQRIPSDVSSRERFFDEELVQTLADGDATLLGARRPAAVS